MKASAGRTPKFNLLDEFNFLSHTRTTSCRGCSLDNRLSNYIVRILSLSGSGSDEVGRRKRPSRKECRKISKEEIHKLNLMKYREERMGENRKEEKVRREEIIKWKAKNTRMKIKVKVNKKVREN
jgi:hypothetical protein